ncbi:MAG: OmpA family protein [Bacteroidota bacterium]
MRKISHSTLLTLILAIVLAAPAWSQGGDVKKQLFRADKFFSIKNYKEALPLYLEVVEAGEKDAITYYRLGKCYLNSFKVEDKIKAISYLEFAVADNAAKLPSTAHLELGRVYHMDEQIDKALESYTKYKAKSGNDAKAKAEVNRAIEISNNAKKAISRKKDISVVNLGTNINTDNTEYNPVVSADESIMAFTALRPNTNKNRSSEEFIEEIYVSYKSAGNWTLPKKIPINSDYNVGTAGLSPDGQRMLIFMGGENNTGNIFTIDKSGEKWSEPTIIDEIRSRHLESTASVTPDGKTIYFASNRPGGFGGFDIYKVEKQDDGTWSRPKNLGEKINTKYDDDAPFIHPDQVTLFFNSNGHNTIGGKDIFRSRLTEGAWSTPENMGYPINTTLNDDYFTLTADGRKAYFSSDRKGGSGGQDIYSVEMPDEDANIPLTLIKGRILDAETKKALPTKIYVVDNETHKKLDFVYNPDAESGDYLIILPPAKNYDIIIESDGFLPYTLNINVPNQTYFYELYQQILLKTITQFGVKVGQEVEVKNAFYDTNKEKLETERKQHEAKLLRDGDVDPYDLMEDLIKAGDQDGIDYLLELMFATNPIDEINFDEIENENLEAAARTYYYDETDESKFEKKDVGGETILSLPTFFVTEEAEKRKQQPKEPVKSYDPELLGKELKVYFAVGKSDLDGKYNGQLDEMLKLLKANKGLGVQISGYASAEGDEDFNRELSNKRAISVLNYLNFKGIVRRRIVARGYGETKEEKSSAEESRRVEVRLVDLQKVGRAL